MKLSETVFTFHAREERKGRVNLIDVIGAGEVVVKAPDLYGKSNIEVLLTDTGVMAIHDKVTNDTLTVWIASPKQAQSVCRRAGLERVPKGIWNRVNYYYNTEWFRQKAFN